MYYFSIPGPLTASTKSALPSKSQPPLGACATSSSNSLSVNNSSRHAQPLLPPSQNLHSNSFPSTAIPTSIIKPGPSSPTNNSPNSLLPVPVATSNVASCLQQKSQVYSHRCVTLFGIS